METTTAYRLYEQRDGELYPLQHKTRTPVPVGEWVEADVKVARDGSGDRWYRAGFHSVETLEAAVAYMSHFRTARRERLRVVRVEISDVWRKEHSPAPVLLSRFMRVVETVDLNESEA